MPFEFIQVPANGQGTAKEELNRLLRGRKIVSVRKEFVAHGEDSFWAFCLEYLEGVAERDRLSPEKVDYKTILSEADFAVFSKLRSLRKELAEKEAVPAYAIFTNEQLAEMVRRKDDFVCWSREKAPLLAAGRSIERWVEQELGLALKHPPCPQRTALGMDFLGYRIHCSHTTLCRRSKVRYRRKMGLLARLAAAGRIGGRALQERLTALTAFCLPVRSWGFRRRTLADFRSAAIGHEPGESGRQLEQQLHQPPLREPQQQHPGQPQQQPGLPPGPQLRPAALEGADANTGLNRPPSGPTARAAGKGQTGRPVPVASRMRGRKPRAANLSAEFSPAVLRPFPIPPSDFTPSP